MVNPDVDSKIASTIVNSGKAKINGNAHIKGTTHHKKLTTNIPSTVEISTLIGRYYAMDRDNRWDRVEKAYNLIVNGKGDYQYDSLEPAIKDAYKRNETDEFVSPTIVGNYKGIEDEDSLLIVNFRSDRVREILASFLKDKFTYFSRKNNLPPFKNALGMMQYSEELNKYIPSIKKKASKLYVAASRSNR